jgi:hypothetical protein
MNYIPLEFDPSTNNMINQCCYLRRTIFESEITVESNVLRIKLKNNNNDEMKKK